LGILDKFLKNKFYLELDNDKENYTWSTKASKKTKSKQVKTESAKADKVSLEDNKVSSEGDKEQESIKPANRKDTANDAQSSPQPINTSYSEEPTWIKSLYNKQEETVEEEVVVVEKTFATDSLIAKPRPNRRPGGSINKFRDLARELR